MKDERGRMTLMRRMITSVPPFRYRPVDHYKLTRCGFSERMSVKVRDLMQLLRGAQRSSFHVHPSSFRPLAAGV
jgi:hypothetical protein